MIRIAVGYVAIVVLCAVLILLNPLDFMGRDARQAQLQDAAPVVGLAETSTASDTVSDSVAATTAAILADLTAAAENPETVALEPLGKTDESLHEVSVAVLAGLKGGEAAPDAGSLEGMVAQALVDGKTDEAIDQIVNEAVAQGDITAPAGLTTVEGKVDTAVLLASIVAEAQGDEFGQGDLSEPTDVIEGGTLAMQAATQDVLYVVQAGDSLGSLALRFYGDAGLYTAIFKANRQVLETPESLSNGMKLLIPARSSL